LLAVSLHLFSLYSTKAQINLPNKLEVFTNKPIYLAHQTKLFRLKQNLLMIMHKKISDDLHSTTNHLLPTTMNASLHNNMLPYTRSSNKRVTFLDIDMVPKTEL